MKKVYISGPISGLDREEYMARFAFAELLMKKEGYKVLNPTRLAPCREPWLYKLLGYKLTLLYDLWHLMRCTHIFMLPGWTDSKGSSIEYQVSLAFKINDADEDNKRIRRVDEFIEFRRKNADLLKLIDQ